MFFTTKKSRYFLGFILPFTLIGCIDEQKNNINRQAHAMAPKVNTPSLPTTGSLSPHATQLAEAVQQSQARLATSRKDICPKLIEFSTGTTTTVRTNEVMRQQSCKYFLYPDVGNKLNVQLSNKNMKAILAQPKLYDFENGDYLVENPGKHVLEISYKSHHGDRPAQHYNVAFFNN